MLKKALVVDNDFFFVEFLSEILEKRGYRVIKASDGKEGVLELKEGPFDVLFADLVMPKIDGQQLIRIARQRFPNDPFPIVIVSGTLIEQVEEISDIGANHYVAKGPLEEMTEKIEALLDRIEGKAGALDPGAEIIEPGRLYPRTATSELVLNLKFHKAVIESAGVGILVVDRDARIIGANSESVALLQIPLEEILGSPVTALFPKKERATVVDALKRVAQNQELKRLDTEMTVRSGPCRLIVSLIRVEQDIAGWVLVLEGSAYG